MFAKKKKRHEDPSDGVMKRECTVEVYLGSHVGTWNEAVAHFAEQVQALQRAIEADCENMMVENWDPTDDIVDV